MSRREIRSYVIREGRMTEGQRKALETLWPRFGLDTGQGVIDPVTIFGNDNPLAVEIGFGMGDSLLDMAIAAPAVNFIGIEVHRPGVGHLLMKAAAAGLDNLRVYNDDSVPVVSACLPDACADRIQIFFPDPWHKKRHHKRRLITPDFAALLTAKLKPGGIVHIATDWVPYADAIAEVMAGVDGIEPCTPPGRPVTKYERRGRRLGHEVTDLAYRRSGAASR